MTHAPLEAKRREGGRGGARARAERRTCDARTVLSGEKESLVERTAICSTSRRCVALDDVTGSACRPLALVFNYFSRAHDSDVT